MGSMMESKVCSFHTFCSFHSLKKSTFMSFYLEGFLLLWQCGLKFEQGPSLLSYDYKIYMGNVRHNFKDTWP